MDPLSDVLRVVRLNGAHFFQAAASGGWGVEVTAAKELSPRILPGSEHLISYHLVMTGRCWGGLKDEPLLALEAGDVILFPHGHAHIMTGRPESAARRLPILAVPRFPGEAEFGDTTHPDVTLVCGFFGCDLAPFNPLCASLPRQLRLRGLSDGLVGTFARQVVEETRMGRAGADSMLTRLAELMFIEVLRRYLESLPPEQGGWLAGVRDPLVGRALALLHQRPGHPWTLAELATAAASSRSHLAERFTQLVGVPPMQYLTEWRMQVAAGFLTESGAKVAAVASKVGYESEAAFSRAFKKASGVSPGAWRKLRR
ncbi:MAG TPA: AraC family transcriptional regulator [Gemmatimonadales bacterium]|nr:AraC family transcriptional regulator [Gemmatimonadales bacterium]